MRRRPRTLARLGPMIALVAVVLVAVVAPAVRPAAAATVTARVRYDTITLGQTVGVIGTTSPRTTVVVERRLTTTWAFRALATTGTTGAFAIPITPGQTGIYTLRVRTGAAISPVFYLRILGPLTLDPGGLDPGGLGTLRLGMTLTQAKATHWITGIRPEVGGAQPAIFPAAVHASAAFAWGKLRKITVYSGGSTVEGLKAGDPASRIPIIYRPPTWNIAPADVPPILLTDIRQGGKTIYRIISSAPVSTWTVTYIQCGVG